MIEIIWQITFEYVLGAPGALILWSCSGFKGSYSNYFADNQNKSAILGFVFWITVFVIIGICARANS